MGADLQLLWQAGAAGAMQLLRHARGVAARHSLRVQSIGIVGAPTPLGVLVQARVMHAGEEPGVDLQEDIMDFVDSL